jgi:hypothetical protein
VIVTGGNVDLDKLPWMQLSLGDGGTAPPYASGAPLGLTRRAERVPPMNQEETENE